MNIFKILASGDGTISEPNVSAFLGYLLNPKASHGLGDELLKRVFGELSSATSASNLSFLRDKNQNLRNLTIGSVFDFEVLLEQAFPKANKDSGKDIVDVVILCFEQKVNKGESLASKLLEHNTRGELRQVFLIENKIKDGATREGQLSSQCEATIQTLGKMLPNEDVAKMLSVIFVTPDSQKASDEFKSYDTQDEYNVPKVHLKWCSDDDESRSTIYDFLESILVDESRGEIEPINDYTKHTIKSFMTFISNGFRSAIEEELNGGIVRDVHDDFFGLKNKYPDCLGDKEWKLSERFNDYINDYRLSKKNLNVRYSRTHVVSVFDTDNDFKNGKKFFSLSSYSNTKLMIRLIFRNHKLSSEVKYGELLALIQKNGYRFEENKEKRCIDVFSGVGFEYDRVVELFDCAIELIRDFDSV